MGHSFTTSVYKFLRMSEERDDNNSCSSPMKSGGKPTDRFGGSDEIVLDITDDSSFSRATPKNTTWRAIVSGEASLDKLVESAEAEFVLGKSEAMKRVLWMMQEWSDLQEKDLGLFSRSRKHGRKNGAPSVIKEKGVKKRMVKG
jgi:hypothetical protein